MKINGKNYEILDTLEYITIADSFIRENKIGSGHGEAKLYVGNEGERLFKFFGDFKINCFFCKKDFKLFLEDSKQEYYNPQQDYIKIIDMKERFNKYYSRIEEIHDELLKFELYRVDVEPPRVYVNANSEYWTIMRTIALPNISYLSVLKLKDEKDNIVYYFKIFIDYKSNIVGYQMPEEKEQEQIIENDEKISQKKKDTIIRARIGQGKYREDLLEECPYCPFTLVNDERLLIASHIKPWAKADNKEKIDPKNGFMLTPTYDKLFDRGFITFDDDKKVIVSPWLSPMNQKRLNIYTGLLVPKLPLDEKRKDYLKYHREYVFKS